jgi:hypothetical protein
MDLGTFSDVSQEIQQRNIFRPVEVVQDSPLPKADSVFGKPLLGVAHAPVEERPHLTMDRLNVPVQLFAGECIPLG